jgi:hypothetical protein
MQDRLEDKFFLILIIVVSLAFGLDTGLAPSSAPSQGVVIAIMFAPVPLAAAQDAWSAVRRRCWR